MAQSNKSAQRSVEDIKLFTFKQYSSENGILAVVGAQMSVPHPIERIFYVWDVPAGERRGGHSHYLCQQTLICVNGRCVVTSSDGRREVTHTLDTPNKGLLIPPTIWSSQTYDEADTVVLVLCDRHYEDGDYIRDWNTFLSFKGAEA